ncbi:hypothetical protein CKQ90_33785, partial [Klebsiella pneumoniae]
MRIFLANFLALILDYSIKQNVRLTSLVIHGQMHQTTLWLAVVMACSPIWNEDFFGKLSGLDFGLQYQAKR